MAETLKGQDQGRGHRPDPPADPRLRRAAPGGDAQDVVKEVTVTKVGPYMAYITEHGREVGFYLADGRERGGWACRRMHTAETLKAHLHRRDVFSAVSKATREYIWADRLTTEALEDILRILENPEARR